MAAARQTPGAWPALTVAAALTLAACSRPAAVPATTAPAQAPYPTITLTSAAAPAEHRVDGRVEAVNQGTVSAQTSGEVVAIVHDAGDAVAANGVVLRLRAVRQRSELQQAEAALRAAIAQASDAETRYKRTADMYARGVIARATLDETTALRDSAAAQRDAALAARGAAQEGLTYTEVRMPFAGVVTDRMVQLGEAVAPGRPLFGAAALGAMRVIVDVSQELAVLIRQGATASVTAAGHSFSSTRLMLYPRASDEAAAFRVRIELPTAPAGLLPGMFATVTFHSGSEQRLAVPTSAILERGELTAVYVFDPAGRGRTVLRQVRLGHAQDNSVEVLAGLVAGDLVATDPQLALRHLANPERSAE